MFFYSDENSINFKVYNLKTSYVNSFSEEMENELVNLIGKTLNDLPFICSFLRDNITTLLYAANTNDIIEYIFDYATEKIIVKDSVPRKAIIHNRAQCRHYLKKNIVIIQQNENIKNEIIVNVIALIPYCIGLQIFPHSPRGYIRPEFEEIHFTKEEIVSIGTTTCDIIRNDFTKSIQYKSLCSIIIDEKVNGQRFDAKLYRGNSFIITDKDETQDCEKKQNLILNIKGEIKTDYPVEDEVIDTIITLIYYKKCYNNFFSLLEPINTTLNKFLSSAYKDMYAEGKLRLKKRIIEEFIDLIFYECDDTKDSLQVSYVVFTAAFNALLKVPLAKEMPSSQEHKNSTEESYIFCHENIAHFITVCRETSLKAELKDSDLNDLFYSFINLLSKYKANEELFLKCLYRLDDM